MRHYRFFTYERKGNQTFTNFYGKLIELANAAQLENMGQKEYLMFRIIAGINDPSSVDKLLSIPQADFNLEEVHRVAVACEAAKNYSGLISPKTLPTKCLAKNHSTTLLHQTILKTPVMITIHFLEQQKSNF